MSRLLLILSWILIIVYPLVVFFGLHLFSTQSLGIALVVLAGTRLWLVRKTSGDSAVPLLLALALLLVAAHASLFNTPELLLYYPVAVSLVLLSVFGYSLVSGPTFVERLARLTEPQLSPKAVQYTRKVTCIWCLFFVCNGITAFYTAHFGTRETWALYNGLIAYLLMATIFAVEFLIRLKVKRADNVVVG